MISRRSLTFIISHYADVETEAFWAANKFRASQKACVQS